VASARPLDGRITAFALARDCERIRSGDVQYPQRNNLKGFYEGFDEALHIRTLLDEVAGTE